MSFVNKKSFHKYLAINNSGKFLLISDIEHINNLADIGDKEYIQITVPKSIPTKTKNINFNEIKDFINGDNTIITIKSMINNSLTGLNTIVNGDEDIINIYKNFDIDISIDDRGNVYKIYLFKRTDSYNKEIENHNDIMIMYEAIAE